MWKNKKVACVIPARLASSRFPRKILAPLQGKPLIEWVWIAAKKVRLFDQVVFAIDSEETAHIIESFGGKYFMTSVECNNGTERLIELQKTGKVQADVWVNWQADGPFITESVIEDLLQSCDKEDVDVWTLKKQIFDSEERNSPHVCKVVCGDEGRALYFSRSLIPYYRQIISEKDQKYFKHIGLYAYSQKGLEKISNLPITDLEGIEQLEQLRFLYFGLAVQVHETEQETLEIDLPEHLEKAQKISLG